MSYLTDRFAGHSAEWQFVIWARQFLLFLTATISRHFIINAKDVSNEDNIAEAIGAYPIATRDNFTALNATAADARPEFSMFRATVLWVQTAFALAVLCCFWWGHVRERPYEFAFQNAIESWLYFINVVIILLGGLYTLLNTPFFADVMGAWVQGLIEVVMVVLLVSSCLFSALYLAYGYWGNLQIEGLATGGKRSSMHSDGSGAASSHVPPSVRFSPNANFGAERGGAGQRGRGAGQRGGRAQSPFMRVNRARISGAEHPQGDCGSGAPTQIVRWDGGESDIIRPPRHLLSGGARRSMKSRASRPTGSQGTELAKVRPSGPGQGQHSFELGDTQLSSVI